MFYQHSKYYHTVSCYYVISCIVVTLYYIISCCCTMYNIMYIWQYYDILTCYTISYNITVS